LADLQFRRLPDLSLLRTNASSTSHVIIHLFKHDRFGNDRRKSSPDPSYAQYCYILSRRPEFELADHGRPAFDHIVNTDGDADCPFRPFQERVIVPLQRRALAESIVTSFHHVIQSSDWPGPDLEAVGRTGPNLALSGAPRDKHYLRCAGCRFYPGGVMPDASWVTYEQHQQNFTKQ